MLCKVNYQDNEEGKIDETIDAQTIYEDSTCYCFRDCFGEVIKKIPKTQVETILIGQNFQRRVNRYD